MNKLFIIFALVSLQIAWSQKGVHLKHPDDFLKTEQIFKNKIQWVNENPPKQNNVHQTSKFLIEWLEGCPYMTLTLHNFVLDNISNKNSHLMIVFMANEAQYILQQQTKSSSINSIEYGIIKTIQYYDKYLGNGIKSDSRVNRIKKMIEKGTLKKWISKELK